VATFNNNAINIMYVKGFRNIALNFVIFSCRICFFDFFGSVEGDALINTGDITVVSVCANISVSPEWLLLESDILVRTNLDPNYFAY
jgi:hypothetical protein